MNVNPSGVSAAASSPELTRAQEAQRTSAAGRADSTQAGPNAPDDVQLSQFVRSLRTLAPDSPERQARLEQIQRSLEDGSYQVNAEATADALIRDSVKLGDQAVAAGQS